MKTIICFTLLCLTFAACSTTERSVHDSAHAVRAPYVDLAANLGSQYESDLWKLYDSLALDGLRCGMRAMSLGTEQIVVERDDFDRAKTLATGIVVRDKLTLRIYKSVNFAQSPGASMLEIWKNGQKVREEGFKLYQ